MGSITGGILINTFHPTKKRPASSSINVDQFPFCGKFSSSIHITFGGRKFKYSKQIL